MEKIKEIHNEAVQVKSMADDGKEFGIALYNVTKDFIKEADKAYEDGVLSNEEHHELTVVKYDFLARMESAFPELKEQYN